MNLMPEIKKSKKYAAVYAPLLERIIGEESKKYKKDKEKIKAVKNRLHTIYGAFYAENSVKSAGLLLDGCDSGISIKLMKLNTSSNERLLFVEELYKYIFGIINNKIESNIHAILDIGCGFNPFALPFMAKSISSYYALDIDLNLAKIINKYFKLFNLPEYAGCIDIISEIPKQKADIAFLFKIIPTAETCKKGRGFEILNNLDVKYAAVSFPTKTLCGKNIGMAENYAAFFENSLDYDKFNIIGKNIFPNELVYVLSNKLYINI